MGGNNSKIPESEGSSVDPPASTAAGTTEGMASTSAADKGTGGGQGAADGGDEDFVEAIVCGENELKDGEMREVEVGGKKVLLVRDSGEHHAIGSKCSHYGAPLAKGALCNGHVRCPWHGACFNIRTGDIEDFPGLDSVPRFHVEVANGKVKVQARKTDLENFKRTKKMACHIPDIERTFLIIGGGGAAVACAETLRQEGFQGKLIVASKENCLPYDRPKLSKMLDSKAENLALRKADFYDQHDIDMRTNKCATGVDPSQKSVQFEDGESIKYDKLFVATGGSPRKLTCPGADLENVFILRTPDEGNKIAAEAKDKNVVIIGTSFIGMETAAYFNKKASTVTVLGSSAEPFLNSLGAEIGCAWRCLHEEKGVKFIARNSAKEFVGENGKVKEVVLQNDERIPADVVVVGIGVLPTTDFLKDSGIVMNDRGFVSVSKKMETSIENIYAGGDIVEFPLFLADDKPCNIQHWQMSHQHGRIAALNMLDQDEEIRSVPFFWTQMFGKCVRYCGFGFGYDEIVMHGKPEEYSFVAYYLKNEVVVAAASMGMDPIVAQVAEMMLSGEPLTKAEIKDDPKGWVGRLIE